jgi:hypothetical protein
MRKLLITGAAAGLLLASATAAFAAMPGNFNMAHVNTTTVAVANTGVNFTGGHHSSVRTGDAAAVNNTATVANTNVGRGSSMNNAMVGTTTVAVANSGLNFTKGGSVRTGDAGAGNNTLTVVNTNVSFGR